jgi:SET domain-containing protein
LRKIFQFMHVSYIIMQNERQDALSVRMITSEGKRTFLIKYLSYQNGCFISVSESSDRIGSISVSISSSNQINTAKVIPSKFNPMFINTISERISSMINGICLISLHSLKQLEFDDMKAIMGEIMNLVGDNDNENGDRRKQRKETI